MAKRDVDNWPMVAGTLRSAAFGSEGLGSWIYAVFSSFPPLDWGLPEVVRGRRVRFLYTYQAGGNYHLGYITRFLPNPSNTTRLFDRAPGETIFVRYDPQAPGTSVVLAEDNRQ